MLSDLCCLIGYILLQFTEVISCTVILVTNKMQSPTHANGIPRREKN